MAPIIEIGADFATVVGTGFYPQPAPCSGASKEILQKLENEIGHSFFRARMRGRWVHYAHLAGYRGDDRYECGVSLEAMDVSPTFCREWCLEHPEYAPDRCVVDPWAETRVLKDDALKIGATAYEEAA